MDAQPLQGWTVLNPRSRDQARRLTTLLEAAGAEVAEVPALELGAVASAHEIRDALAALSESGWIVLTSESVVGFLQAAAARRAPGARCWTEHRIAVVGESTGRAVERAGGTVSLVSTTARGEVLGEELAAAMRRDGSSFGNGDETSAALILRAARGAPGLTDALARSNIRFRELGVYDTVVPTLTRAEAERLRRFIEHDAQRVIALTSGECARNLRRLISSIEGEETGDSAIARIAAVAIGPETAEAARAAGFMVEASGRNPRLGELVEVIAGYAANASKRERS